MTTGKLYEGMIHIINDIFTEEERLHLLEDVEPLLVDGDSLAMFYLKEKGRLPGRQSHSTFHLNPDFKWVHDRFMNNIEQKTNLHLQIVTSWVNYTDGSQKLNYHIHRDGDYCVVYYLKTFPFINSGTKFEKKFVRVPQNSLLLFPCNLRHTSPNSIFRYKRYTIALIYNLLK